MRFAAFLIGLALLAPTAAHAASAARMQGEAQFRAGDHEGAAASLERAVRESPADAAAHHLLASAYGLQANTGGLMTKMRLVGKIREHYETAVELAPDEIEYRESLLQYYAQAPSALGGGIDKARAQADEIARRDAQRGRLAAAAILRLEGQHDEALAMIRSAEAARPDDARTALRHALYLQELKRWDESFTQLHAMVGRMPAAMSGWYQLGRTAVLANQRHAEGETAFRRYLAGIPGINDPPLAAAHWRLGILYEQMGRKADARLEYQAALKLDPKHREASAALAKLK